MAIEQGCWIASESQIGKVKEVYDDGLLDIVLYDRSGNKIGRESPPEGGPTDFEPCCDPDGWRRIEKPSFPLSRFAYISELVHFC